MGAKDDEVERERQARAWKAANELAAWMMAQMRERLWKRKHAK